jgi:hypothetical protein
MNVCRDAGAVGCVEHVARRIGAETTAHARRESSNRAFDTMVGSREKANSPSRAKVIYVPEAGRKACVPSTPVCPLQATFDDEKISDVRSSVYSGVRNIANGQMEEEKAIILRSALEDR